MADFVYVNVLNEGQLPWINAKGPLFGYRMAIGAFQLLSRDPRITIQIIRSPEEAEAARKKYYESKEPKQQEPIILHDEVVVNVEESLEILDEVVIPETVVEETVNLTDDEFDAILDEVLDDLGVDTEDTITRMAPVQVEIEEIKKYTDDDLSGMTKNQMKAILRERGYESGPYGPKYHDTVDSLKRKVLSTQ